MNDIEKAIEVLKYYKPKGNESIYERGATHKDRESFNLAISALEKQIPKKPIEATWDYEAGYECPTCKYVVEQNQKYCSVCGQKLATDINWKWDSVQFD